jgi:hypothetical protein
MDVQPPILSEAVADQIHRSGRSEIGEFTQAQLLAAGIRHADAYDDNHAGEVVEGALEEGSGDAEALRLISSVTKSPLFSGTWTKRIPERGEELVYFEGMDLPDGSPGVLTGVVDTRSSRWRYAVHGLADLPPRFARSLFEIKDPNVPEESIEIANGGLGMVWPRGRWESRPRQTFWLLACPTSGTRAHLRIQRNFGFKRSERRWQGLVSEEELASRMLELFEQCAREGGRRQ